MTSKYFRTSIYLLPSLSEALERAIGRWQGAATEGAAAGRIISTVARRSSQYTATAAAPAVSVARTNIAKFTRIHMSAFLRDCGSNVDMGTVDAIRKPFTIKE